MAGLTFPWNPAPAPTTGGYMCVNCRAWVPLGSLHSCMWKAPATAPPPPPRPVDWTPTLIASIERLCGLVERLIALQEEEE